ncbi:hypothetical protein Trydic_g12463 [Trypoxylus dichotomus]
MYSISGYCHCLRFKFIDAINKQVHTEYRDTMNIQKTIHGNRKAPGRGGISNTAVKHLTLQVYAIIRHQHYLKTWTHATIIILYKSGKSKNKADGYRPIILLPGLSLGASTRKTATIGSRRKIHHRGISIWISSGALDNTAATENGRTQHPEHGQLCANCSLHASPDQDI